MEEENCTLRCNWQN